MRVLPSLVLATLLVVLAAGLRGSGPPSPGVIAPGAVRADEVTVGVLGSRAVDLGTLAELGVTSVTLEVAWDRVEPVRGVVDQAYVGEVRARAEEIRSAGLRPVLDAGLQYPPSWVMALPDARFVNQLGQAWHGVVGADVPDAVFNDEVRAAQAAYVATLGEVLAGVALEAVRVGGLPNNELSYPVPTYDGTTNSYWAFSADARLRSPVPGYVPGQGTETDASRFLRWYTRSLDRYGLWLARRYRAAFGPDPTLQLLMPSWGMRPGDRAAAVEGLLAGDSHGERTHAVNHGLTWTHLARRAERLPGPVMLYSTWADAADQGSDPVHVSPMVYVAGLARRSGLLAGGENTGRNDAEALRRTFERVDSLGLSAVFWMNGEQLASGAYATMDDLAAAVRGTDLTPG